MRVAVIDLGTFSAILLVAELRRGRLIPLHEERTTVDLAYESGAKLSSSGLGRAVRALKIFQRTLDSVQIDRGMIVATAAIRHARNRSSSIKLLSQQCNLPFKVLSAKSEAEYSARGALIGLPRLTRSSLVVDIGGGSSEFILPKSGVYSGLQIGAAWATKSWGPDAPRDGARRDLYYLAAADQAVLHLNTGKFDKRLSVVGLGGTITTLAAINHRMRSFEVDTVHGTCLSRVWIESLATEMCSMSQTALQGLVPFDPSRARVLLAGTYLWSAVLNRLNADRVSVSARGLRWGVAAHLAGLP